MHILAEAFFIAVLVFSIWAIWSALRGSKHDEG